MFNLSKVQYQTNSSSVYSPWSEAGWSSLISKDKLLKKPASTFIETTVCSSMLSNREGGKTNKAQAESTSSILRSKLISKTVIKSEKKNEKSSISKLLKLKPQKKSKMLEFKDQMNSKIHQEYNIKRKEKENLCNQSKLKTPNLAYGERMLMLKYKNQPKFMGNLNSTLSPRIEDKTLFVWTSSKSTKFKPMAAVSAGKLK